MKLVDLSHTLENGMPLYPGLSEPKFERIQDLDRGDPCVVTKFEMTTHLGTHLDCSAHVKPDGFYSDTKDINFFAGSGIVIDCSNYKEGSEIGMEALEKYAIDGIEYILFYTGWSRYWGQDKFFKGFHLFSDELLDYLANCKSIKGLGLEYLSLERLTDERLSKHEIFLGRDKCIVEGLTNLEGLLGKRFTFMALPLKIKNGEASPVRAAAILEE